MYERMYKLEEVLVFFANEFNVKNKDERITKLYNKISNPHIRVNDNDKQWVAYVSQASEDTTTVNAIREILIKELPSLKIPEKKELEKAVDEVGKEFKHLIHKPRIPFYISVLSHFL